MPRKPRKTRCPAEPEIIDAWELDTTTIEVMFTPPVPDDPGDRGEDTCLVFDEDLNLQELQELLETLHLAFNLMVRRYRARLPKPPTLRLVKT